MGAQIFPPFWSLEISDTYLMESGFADEQQKGQGGTVPDNKAASFARAFAKIMESGSSGRGLLQVPQTHLPNAAQTFSLSRLHL